MPRKKQLKKEQIVVTVNDAQINVILHPPTGKRTSWYAYWTGLKTSRSTGHPDRAKAIAAVEQMLSNDGKLPTLREVVLSDEEFEAIQRQHFARITDPAAQARADKTLDDCLEAIDAFRQISGVQPVSRATPDDCAAFQRAALQLPRNWRKKYPKSKQDVNTLSPNTVLKWSRALQAAFERANRTAGKKCVRGVVAPEKLLTENPWKQFTWIEETPRPIRQFSGEELISILDYFENGWEEVRIAPLVAKVHLWSQARRKEVASLCWDQLKGTDNEHHFEIIGKWGVEKWFRIPESLYTELCEQRTPSKFVFAALVEQLQKHHRSNGAPNRAALVAEDFSPDNLGDWFHARIVDWSEKHGKEHATPHCFRKTSLQHARRGEDVNRQIAADARLSEQVLMTNYVKETDEERRHQSNRTYQRILASLPSEVACRYGHVLSEQMKLEEAIRAALDQGEFVRVQQLTARLAELKA